MDLFFNYYGILSLHITSNVVEIVVRNGGCGEEIMLALFQ